jgi:hypothetical protein
MPASVAAPCSAGYVALYPRGRHTADGRRDIITQSARCSAPFILTISSSREAIWAAGKDVLVLRLGCVDGWRASV